MAVLIRRAKVIDKNSPHHGSTIDILIDGGMIQDIGDNLQIEEGANRGIEEITIPSLSISPGFVDLFADYREPGYEQKETIATGLATAAKGGFTNVFLLPNTLPVSDSRSGMRYALEQGHGSPVSLHPLGAVSQGIAGKALAEMMDMRASGAIAFTDGWKPVQSAGLMMKALEYVKAFDGLIIQVPVDQSLAAGGLMHEGITSTRLGMPGTPSIAESIMVHRDIELAAYAGSRLHLTGISTAQSVSLIRKAKAEGVSLTCSVTPYHLLLTDVMLENYDSMYKLNPPLRTESDRQALIEGIADGTIDCIASHHRPQDWDAKAKEFEYAGEGMAIQEIAFPIAWEALKSKVSVDRIVDAFTTAPRSIFGLSQGGIFKGSQASFTLFGTQEDYIFSAESTPSLSRNNPFEGKRLTAKAHKIFTTTT